MPDLNEKTKVSLPAASWWHLLIIVATIIWWGAAIKHSIDATQETATRALDQSLRNDGEIRKLEMDVSVFHRQYEDFNRQYELDMDRYIRERPDQHR